MCGYFIFACVTLSASAEISRAHFDLTRVDVSLIDSVIEISSPTSGRFRFAFGDLGDTPNQLTSVRLDADGNTVDFQVTASGRRLMIEGVLPEGVHTLRMSYTVDPDYYPPGPREGLASRRGFFTPESALIRTPLILPVSRLLRDGLYVNWTLPEHWLVCAPWPLGVEGHFLGGRELSVVDYMAAGPFDIAEIKAGDQKIVVARHKDAQKISVAGATKLGSLVFDRLGPLEFTTGIRCAYIFPKALIQGGAAGRHGLAQNDSAITLAHEMVHWWTRAGLTGPEAEWFHEGFTEYMAIDTAYDSGLIGLDMFRAAMADLQAEMNFLEREKPIALVDASIRIRETPQLRRLVYSKGALLAHHLSERAGEMAVWNFTRAVEGTHRKRQGNDSLFDALATVVPDKETQRWMRANVTEALALPHVDFGPSNRSSGRGRFFPEPQETP